MNTTHQFHEEPRLAPPGAGLPLLEQLLARYWLMPRASRNLSLGEAVHRFRKEGKKVHDLVAPLDFSSLEQRVLIARLPGLEDSSRYWSVSHTVEHLVTVGDGIVDLIVKLSKGIQPETRVDVANFKPQGKISGAEAAARFDEFLDRSTRRLNGEIGDYHSTTKFAHPWFGAMTAKQWGWLLGGHQRVHRRQIECILEKGASTRPQ